MRKIMIVAGGTGGHMFPGLALAERLLAEGWVVSWVSGTKELEKRVLSSEPRVIHETVNFHAVRGQSWARLLWLPVRLLRALWQSDRLLRWHRPDVVMCFGGYITVPVAVMAWLRRRPVLIHEQNARMGLANRCLLPLARHAFLGFPLPRTSGSYVGNPVRSSLHQLPAPRLRFEARSGPLRILILGGSLGARTFNEFFPSVFGLCDPEVCPVVYHQTGTSVDLVAARYAEHHIQATVQPFFDDMASVYADVDFVICRAGALTIAELSCVGLGALCIPYPFAVDDHQYDNAQILAKAGAALVWREETLSEERFLSVWAGLSRESCLAYAVRAYQLLPMSAVDKMATYCADL